MSKVCDLNFLHLLGTGDGTANADRNHSAYLYQFRMGHSKLIARTGQPRFQEFRTAVRHRGCAGSLAFAFRSHRRIADAGARLLAGAPGQGARYLFARGRKSSLVRQMLRTAYLFDEALSFALKFEPLTVEKTDPAGRSDNYALLHDTLERNPGAAPEKIPGCI